MTYTPGVYSATALVGAGLPRRRVVETLERELGLSQRDANAAWIRVTLKQELPDVRLAVHEIVHA
jgi:hypothetical protein